MTAPYDPESYRHYAAYGLSVRSAIPLDEFPPGAAGDDPVVVEWGRGPGWAAAPGNRLESVEIDGDRARFWFRDAGKFEVTGGKRIVAYPNPDAPADLLRLYVEGMLLAMVLHQRGMCVLHASVVEIGGHTVALMGRVGAGKSSLAGALYARGHRVLSDDNAAIRVDGGRPLVLPAYPYVKLFPAIASLLGFHNGALRPLHVSQAKMAGAVDRNFNSNASRLSRVYMLSRDFAAQVEQLSPLEATIELIRNAVPTRWGHAGDAGHLRRCATVATQVPVFTVRTFSSLDGVAEVAGLVEQHCGG